MRLNLQTLLASVRDPAPSKAAIASVVPGLATSRYVLLTTFKRDGAPVATPVWFAAAGGNLVVTSDEQAWKVKRLRRNPRATVAPCDARGRPSGPPVEVIGEVLRGARVAQAEAALNQRYGAALGVLEVLTRLRLRGHRPVRAFMAFRPEADSKEAAVGSL